MKGRFFIGKGRYGALVTSRYKNFTYGRESFSKPLLEIPDNKAHGTYGALLFDERWRMRRAQIIDRDNHSCVICHSEESLQVHHRQYHFIKATQQFKAPWDYEDYLLVTLCEKCHSRGHSKYKVPNVYL